MIKLPGSAFLMLKNGKIAQVSTVFDALALVVQTGAVETPAWWPGRSRPSLVRSTCVIRALPKESRGYRTIQPGMTERTGPS